MNEKHSIRIGGKFIEDVKVLEFFDTNPPLEPIGRITFVTRINEHKLKEIDLKDELIVYENNKRILTGYVDELFYNDSFAIFRCEGYKRAFKSTKLSIEFLPDAKEVAFKAFWFLGRLFNKPEDIKMHEQMREQANFIERDYIVLMPIDNLELDRPIKVLDVLFTKSLDDEYNIIKSSKTFTTDKDWNNNIPKVKVVVRADNFYDAIMKGYNRILTIINLITFRNDLSFIYYKDTKLMEFKNSLFFSRLNLIMKIFCKEAESEHSMFYDLKPKDRTLCKSNDLSDEYFLPLRDFERFYNNPSLEQQNTIILSIQWLSLSIYSDDPIVKLLNSWNSLEFAIKSLDLQDKFSKNEIKILKDELSKFFNKLGEDEILSLSIQQIEIFMSKLNYLNDPPIMEKIRSFLSDHKIPFDENEMNLIAESRKKRNDIQHGRKHQIINNNELEKLRSLIERILLVRASLS
jgi:hypothetical protein